MPTPNRPRALASGSSLSTASHADDASGTAAMQDQRPSGAGPASRFEAGATIPVAASGRCGNGTNRERRAGARDKDRFEILRLRVDDATVSFVDGSMPCPTRDVAVARGLRRQLCAVRVRDGSEPERPRYRSGGGPGGSAGAVAAAPRPSWAAGWLVAADVGDGRRPELTEPVVHPVVEGVLAVVEVRVALVGAAVVDRDDRP